MNSVICKIGKQYDNITKFKVDLAYVIIFLVWTRVQKDNKYVEIKGFSKVGMKLPLFRYSLLSSNEIPAIRIDVSLFTYLFT